MKHWKAGHKAECKQMAAARKGAEAAAGEGEANAAGPKAAED